MSGIGGPLRAAAVDIAAVFLSCRNVTRDFTQMIGGNHRADLGLVVQRIADRYLGGQGLDRGEEIVGDRFMPSLIRPAASAAETSLLTGRSRALDRW